MKGCFSVLLLLLLPHGLFSADIQALRPEFSAVADESAELVEIATGLEFTEGPVWIGGKEGGYLLFSDIPANKIYRWAPEQALSVWRTPSGNSNGLLLDSRGRLLVCEHGGRRVSLTLDSGELVTLCDSFNGGRLNSPNDVALGADGSLWFTDPPYGLGKQEESEQPACYVFRLAPGAKAPTAVVEDFNRPNGIVFSPDKKVLYISDSGSPHHIRYFRVAGESLEEIGVFAVISPGGPDGMCVDSEGRLYSTAGDGVHVFSPDGTLIGKIITPRMPANCCFGGKEWKTLFITARPDVYAVKLKVKGLP